MLLSGCAGTEPLPVAAAGAPATTVRPPPGAQRARVAKVVDGDTLHLVGSGAGPLRPGVSTKVRILGIDTPEVDTYGGQAQCYGDEAAAFAGAVLREGSTVQVVGDREAADRYGRTLLYVWTAEGAFYDEAAVRSGFARAYVVSPNRRYADAIRAAERAARLETRGLWGACAG